MCALMASKQRVPAGNCERYVHIMPQAFFDASVGAMTFGAPCPAAPRARRFLYKIMLPADDMGVAGHTQKTQTPMSSAK